MVPSQNVAFAGEGGEADRLVEPTHPVSRDHHPTEARMYGQGRELSASLRQSRPVERADSGQRFDRVFDGHLRRQHYGNNYLPDETTANGHSASTSLQEKHTRQ